MAGRILVFISFLFFISCTETARNSSTTETITESLTDSVLKKEKPVVQHEYFSKAFIAVDGATIFADSTLKNTAYKPKLGDSLEVLEHAGTSYNGFGYFPPENIYKVVSLNGDSTIKGYLKGRQLGAGGQIILADSSKALIIYRYLKLAGEVDEILDNPCEVLLVKGNKTLAKHNFTAYSDLGFEQNFTREFKPAITLFTINYGYPACGYTQGQYLFSWDGKTLKLIEKTNSSSDSGIYAHWTDWIFPGDSLGEAGHLISRDYHFEVDEKENVLENDTTMELIGLRKYKYSNYNFTLVLKDTTIRNLRNK